MKGVEISEDQACQSSDTMLHHLGPDLMSAILRPLGGDLHGSAASCKDLLFAALGSGSAALRLDASKADLAWYGM